MIPSALSTITSIFGFLDIFTDGLWEMLVMYQRQTVRRSTGRGGGESAASTPSAALVPRGSEPGRLAFTGSTALPGLPRWPRGWDSTLQTQGAQVGSLVRELNPTCRNQDFMRCSQRSTKTRCSQINILKNPHRF